MLASGSAELSLLQGDRSAPRQFQAQSLVTIETKDQVRSLRSPLSLALTLAGPLSLLLRLINESRS